MSRAHRWLMRLLPRARRAQHGEEIGAIFSDVLEQRRAEGRSTLPLWIQEARGLARYGMRERMPPPALDARLAWRGLRSRGWRAVIAIALLAIAIGGNTVMFTVADALLFRPTTYREPDRLVELQIDRGPTSFSTTIRPQDVDDWRQQGDLFEMVEAYLNKVVFLVGQGTPELTPTADVTPGLIHLLGIQPRWGRALTQADAAERYPIPALISESVARARFGSPEAAIDQQLETAAEPLLVVGVMDASFRFPTGTIKIWRALDLRGPLARGYGGGFPIARLTGQASAATASAILIDRYKQAGRTLVRGQGTPRLVTLDESHRQRIGPSTLWFLLAMSLCLLATACANVASLELASAVSRTRVWAIHRALGASGFALIRIAACEGLLLLVPALLAALGLAWAGVQAAGSWLPEQLSLRAINTFDIDVRALAFMTAAAMITWILTILPTVLYATRRDTMQLLSTENRSSASRAGVRTRQILSAAQVALAVLMVASGVVAARHYLSRLAIDKGFDSLGLLQVMLTIPPQEDSNVRPSELRLRDALSALAGVSGVTSGSAPPSAGDSPMPMPVRVDGRPEPLDLTVQRKWIEDDYFRVVGIPLLEGRSLAPGEHDSAIVVSDRFAAAVGLGEHVVGKRVLLSPRDQWRTIVGTVSHIPSDRDLTGADNSAAQVYVLRRPPPPPSPVPVQRGQYSGAAFAAATMIVRADSAARASDVLATVRRTVPGYAAKVTVVDDNYALYFARLRLIRQTTVAFGVVALIVSLAGIYGVMSYIAAARRREFGVRVALGARRSDIRRLIINSSLKMIVAGTVLGLASALAVSKWAGATVYGIRTFEPAILAAVGAAVTLLALMAVWRPAESAAAADPVTLLRD